MFAEPQSEHRWLAQLVPTAFDDQCTIIQGSN